MGTKRPTLDDLLEQIVVSDDVKSARESGNTSMPDGWFGVSDERSGGYIAYFANEEDAYGFRLWLINARLNGKASAMRYEPEK
jgi:hypothetical protein